MDELTHCLDRLHRAGWSVGEARFGPLWQVDPLDHPAVRSADPLDHPRKRPKKPHNSLTML
jgi:hypothetical protein